MLEDATAALAKNSEGQRRLCSLSLWVGSLDPTDQEIAWGLVDNRDYNNSQLAEYLQSKGANTSQQNLSRHRNGRCCGQRVHRA